MSRILSLLWILLLALSSGFAEESKFPNTPRNEADFLKLQELVQRLLPQIKKATVGVIGMGAGSGVIISPDGCVLTAGHVSGKPGTRVQIILSNGKRVDGVSMGKVNFADAGMIKIVRPGEYDFAQLSGATARDVGAWCLALGHPGGYDEKRGPVLRVGRVIWAGDNTMRTDCKLIGGDSGGPLFDLEGRVIGIHSRISRHPDENYHVPIGVYVNFQKQMMASQEVSRSLLGFLGVRLAEVRGTLVVTDVIPDTAASRGRLKVGDVITKVDGSAISREAQFQAKMGSKKVDDPFSMQIQRGPASLPIKVKLGKRRTGRR